MRKTFPAALLLSAMLLAGQAPATPPSGFTGTTLALGHFGDITVRRMEILQDAPGPGNDDDVWLSIQRTRGSSDLYVQNNTWAPGGTTGWHTHPGHSLIIVTAGAVTVYDGDDPSCTPHVYTAGMGFVDPGGTHVHVIRNEGSVEARTTAVQLIPAGATRRVDALGNAACPF